MKKAIVSLAQIKYYDVHSSNNLLKIKKYIAQAKKKRADIICFPESVVHRTKTLDLDDRIIMEIQQVCKENSIWCIINDDMKIDGKNYNAALLINREGKITGNYKKINLYDDGNNLPGKNIAVFQTDFAKIGVVVCWDIAFQKLFHEMKMQGVQIVFCPSQWCYEEKAHEKNHRAREVQLLRSLIMARAFENLFYVALCNPILDREDIVPYSGISSPHGILKEIVGKEGLITSEINLNEIKKLEKLYKR